MGKRIKRLFALILCLGGLVMCFSCASPMKKLPVEVEKLLYDAEWQVRKEGIKRAVMLGPEYVPALCEIMTDPDRKHYMKEDAANAIFEMGQPGIAALLPIERRHFEGGEKSVFGHLYFYTQGHFAMRHGEIGNMLLAAAENKQQDSVTAAILLTGFMRDLRRTYEALGYTSPTPFTEYEAEEKVELEKKVTEMSQAIKEALAETLERRPWPLFFYAHTAMTFVEELPQAKESVYFKAVSNGKAHVRNSALSFLEDVVCLKSREYYYMHTDLDISSWSLLKARLVDLLGSDSLGDGEKGSCREVLLAAWPDLSERADSILGVPELKSIAKTADSDKALEACLKLGFYRTDWKPERYENLLREWLSNENAAVRRRAITLESHGKVEGQWLRPSGGITFGCHYGPAVREGLFKCLWDSDHVVRRRTGRLVEDRFKDYGDGFPSVPTEEWWEDSTPEECRKTAEKLKEVIMKKLGAK
jgi:hypothetical protein